MKSNHLQFIGLVVSCFVILAGHAQAQVPVLSGRPGDGIPDIYYYAVSGVMFPTSVGVVSRPEGTLLVDTDGTDMLALLIGGPDASASTPDDGNYLVGSTARLPDPAAPAPLFASDWVTGFINGSSQWVRTNPLGTDGFVGVVGEYDDPFGIFPNLGIANYGAFANFDAIFDDGAGGMWEVLYATSSGTFLTNVCYFPGCVPEPTSMSLLVLTVLSGLLVLRSTGEMRK